MPTATNPPTTRRKRPRQARAKATVEAILEATSQVLVAEGYARMTTTRVAERAGVSVGTLYQYFADKDALVRTLKQRHVGQIMGAMAEAGLASEGGSLGERVRATLSALVAAKAKDGALSMAISMTILELDGRLGLDQGTDEAEQLVRMLLEQHADEVDVDDLDRAAHTLVNAVDGVILAILTDPTRPIEDPRNVDELVRLVNGYLGLAD